MVRITGTHHKGSDKGSGATVWKNATPSALKPPSRPAMRSARPSLGLSRFGGRVNAFGHIVSCRDGVSPVGAVGNVRITFSKGLVDAFLASTGPAASIGASGIA